MIEIIHIKERFTTHISRRTLRRNMKREIDNNTKYKMCFWDCKRFLIFLSNDSDLGEKMNKYIMNKSNIKQFLTCN